MFKTIKYISISFFILAVSSLLLSKFFIYKVKEESIGYSITVDKINLLSYSYKLCSGIESSVKNGDCKYLKKQIEQKLDSLETNYPFTSLYVKFYH
jgi:hypothetical protein